MASGRPNEEGKFAAKSIDGSKYHVTLVLAGWYEHIVTSLATGCEEVLQQHGVNPDNISRASCPGPFVSALVSSVSLDVFELCTR